MVSEWRAGGVKGLDKKNEWAPNTQHLKRSKPPFRRYADPMGSSTFYADLPLFRKDTMERRIGSDLPSELLALGSNNEYGISTGQSVNTIEKFVSSMEDGEERFGDGSVDAAKDDEREESSGYMATPPPSSPDTDTNRNFACGIETTFSEPSMPFHLGEAGNKITSRGALTGFHRSESPTPPNPPLSVSTDAKRNAIYSPSLHENISLPESPLPTLPPIMSPSERRVAHFRKEAEINRGDSSVPPSSDPPPPSGIPLPLSFSAKHSLKPIATIDSMESIPPPPPPDSGAPVMPFSLKSIDGSGSSKRCPPPARPSPREEVPSPFSTLRRPVPPTIPPRKASRSHHHKRKAHTGDKGRPPSSRSPSDIILQTLRVGSTVAIECPSSPPPSSSTVTTTTTTAEVEERHGSIPISPPPGLDSDDEETNSSSPKSPPPESPSISSINNDEEDVKNAKGGDSSEDDDDHMSKGEDSNSVYFMGKKESFKHVNTSSSFSDLIKTTLRSGVASTAHVEPPPPIRTILDDPSPPICTPRPLKAANDFGGARLRVSPQDMKVSPHHVAHVIRKRMDEFELVGRIQNREERVRLVDQLLQPSVKDGTITAEEKAGLVKELAESTRTPHLKVGEIRHFSSGAMSSKYSATIPSMSTYTTDDIGSGGEQKAKNCVMISPISGASSISPSPESPIRESPIRPSPSPTRPKPDSNLTDLLSPRKESSESLTTNVRNDTIDRLTEQLDAMQANMSTRVEEAARKASQQAVAEALAQIRAVTPPMSTSTETLASIRKELSDTRKREKEYMEKVARAERERLEALEMQHRERAKWESAIVKASGTGTDTKAVEALSNELSLLHSELQSMREAERTSRLKMEEENAASHVVEKDRVVSLTRRLKDSEQMVDVLRKKFDEAIDVASKAAETVRETKIESENAQASWRAELVEAQRGLRDEMSYLRGELVTSQQLHAEDERVIRGKIASYEARLKDEMATYRSARQSWQRENEELVRTESKVLSEMQSQAKKIQLVESRRRALSLALATQRDEAANDFLEAVRVSSSLGENEKDDERMTETSGQEYEYDDTPPGLSLHHVDSPPTASVENNTVTSTDGDHTRRDNVDTDTRTDSFARLKSYCKSLAARKASNKTRSSSESPSPFWWRQYSQRTATTPTPKRTRTPTSFKIRAMREYLSASASPAPASLTTSRVDTRDESTTSTYRPPSDVSFLRIGTQLREASLGSPAGSMMPTVNERKLCDALWNHSSFLTKDSPTRVITEKSFVIALRPFLVRRRSRTSSPEKTLRAMFRELDFESKGFVLYTDIAHAVSGRAGRSYEYNHPRPSLRPRPPGTSPLYLSFQDSAEFSSPRDRG